jgi:hypothetical protein
VVSLEHKSLKYIRMELEDTRVVSEAFLTSAWNLAQGATFDANEPACRGDRLFAKHAAAAAHSLKPLATGHKRSLPPATWLSTSVVACPPSAVPFSPTRSRCMPPA